MSARAHAILSPSSAERWLHCTPSARLQEQYTDKGSRFAEEGTDAHALAEAKLRAAISEETSDIKVVRDGLQYYDEAMDGYTDDYVNYIREILAREHQPTVMVEQRLDFTRYVPEGFGTGDCVIVANGTLYVIDFKYGQGVLVSAEDNPQMKIYALGALEMFDCIYDIDNVCMTIFQPRRENVSVWTTPKADLYAWAETTLKPAATLAMAGEGDYDVGPWCRFCKAAADCRARMEYNLELAQYDFQDPPTLEEAEIEDVLARLDELTNWAEAVKNSAFERALGGYKWQNFKLVEGRSVRKYTDADAVVDVLLRMGYDSWQVIKPSEPIGISAMEKLLGKADFAKILGPYIDKPAGKPVLVPRSDKRDELNNFDELTKE
jgi:hypothetical protein